MDLFEALSHQRREVRRLLDLARTWPAKRRRRARRPRPVRTAKQLRPSEIALLVADYHAGALIKDLATRFNISRDTVCQHLNRHGVERRQRGLRPDDVPTAAQLYRAGWSLARLAERFNTTDMTVRARLLEVGIRMREPWER